MTLRNLRNAWKDKMAKTMTRPSSLSHGVRFLARLRVVHCCKWILRAGQLAALISAIAVVPSAASAQVAAGSSPLNGLAAPTGPGIDGDSTMSPDLDGSGDDGAHSDRLAESPLTLTSDQIVQVLQENPDLAAELKDMVAQQLQQQGAQIGASDISDPMLYELIATNADVRASAASFLSARGDSTLASPVSASYGARESGINNNLPVSGQSRNGAGSEAPAENEGADSRSSRADRNEATESGTRRSSSLTLGRVAVSRAEDAQASTDLPQVVHRPAPYHLQSMRDLYAQIPNEDAALKRFGSDVFLNRSAFPAAFDSGRNARLDVPLGPDYIVGPGDALKINLWGGVTQTISRTVDNDGRILLPDAGSVDIGGLPLGKAEGLIEGSFAKQYRDVHLSVTVSNARSVRIYIVGDVQRPGGYDISAVATPLSALYAAGGPTAAGSLRVARHLRGDRLIEEIDLYDFLLNGVRGKGARFEDGDTLLVPPAGPQVAISGAVKRPAIYELKDRHASLASVVEDAGGFTAAASASHIAIERIDADGRRETVTLNTTAPTSSSDARNAVAAFPLNDGDRIRIAPILPYSQRVVYLAGHVVRPGRLPYADGMRLSDVLRSYRDMLPEPGPHGQIIRLVPPDLHAEAIEFDVADVLIGNANLALQPFDTVRVFGRYEEDAPEVTIQGEVMQPAVYPLSDGMTAAQLVRMAGGFKRDALLESADLTSYAVVNGNRVTASLVAVRIGSAVAGTDSSADVPLKPGDVLTVHQITGWNEIGQSVVLNGQVKFPGTYGFQEGERLSSVLRRAGGFRETAYPEGAVLVRDQVRDLERKSREELIHQIETTSAAARVSPNIGANDSGQVQKAIQAQQDEIVARLKSEPPDGRQVVHIGPDIDSWANTAADIELRRGDVLTIPKRPSFVLVTGQVYNATALTFVPGKSARWYLQRAGGASEAANRKDIVVVRANGSVIGRHSSGLFESDVLSTRLDPGDVIVVPQKVIGTSLLWRNLLTTAQLASSIAITAAVASF